MILHSSSSESNGNTEIELKSSQDLRKMEVSLAAIMANGTNGIVNWTLEFIEHTPVVVCVSSVLKVEGRTLVKMPEMIAQSIVFGGCEYDLSGKSAGFNIIEEDIPGLSSGMSVEVVSSAYRFKIVVNGVLNSDLKDLFLSYNNGVERTRRNVL